MSKYKVEYIATEDKKGKVVALYIGEELTLPFVPVPGMFIRQDSMQIWEQPPSFGNGYVTAVTYDMDRDVFMCHLASKTSPTSAFWRKIEGQELNTSRYRTFVSMGWD